MAESKQKKKLLLKKKLADDIESSKLISEFNNRNARQTMKKITNITKTKLINQPSSSNNNTQSSFQKKEVQAKEEDTLSLQIEEPMLAEVAGPQLKLNKYHMSFVEKTGNVAKDSIIVTNNGTTAIYYKWKRIDVFPFFKTSILDQEERFFCHANKSIIKPGEMKVFHFTFKSRATGIFEEEWNLECEPPLVQPLSTIKLSGHAIQDDPNVDWRSEIDILMERQHKNRFVEEIVGDIIRGVRTPTPPPPDLEDPEVWKREFEEKNAKYHLYYTPLLMNWLKELQRLIYAELDIGIYEPEHQWDLSMDYLRDKITSIKSQSEYENMLRRYDDLFKIAKIRPYDRSNIYGKCKKILESVLVDYEEISNSIRREKEIIEKVFQEPQDLTEEEIKKRKDEEAKAKAELLKKTKKKPRTEDDEKKVMEEYKTEFIKRAGARLGEKIDYIEKNEVAIRAHHELQTRKRPDRYFYEMLALKKTFKDLDSNIEGRRVVIRIHLKKKDINQFNAEWEADVKAREAEAKAAEEAAKNAKKEAKKPVKKTKEEIAEEARKLKEETERRKFVMGIEDSSLQQAISIAKYFLEQLAKLVMLYASFGETTGVPNPETSLKYFYEYLKTKIEQPCYWEPSCYVPDMLERQETEYAENSCIVFENCWHEPRELGYFVDANGNLTKLDYQEVDQFAEKLSEYGGYFVIEDRDLLFKKHTSVAKVRPAESAFFGRSISGDVTLAAQALLHSNYEPKLSKRRKREREKLPKIQKKKSVFLLGGEYHPESFLAIDTVLGCYDKIFLAGKIGIMFFMFQNKLEKLGDITLDEVQKGCIQKLLDNAKELNKEIIIPNKFIISNKPAAKEGTGEWIQAIVASERSSWPVLEPKEPEKTSLIDEDLIKKEEHSKSKENSANVTRSSAAAGKKDSKPPTAKVGDKKDDKKDTKKNLPQVEEKPLDHSNPYELDPNKIILGYDHEYINNFTNLLQNTRSLFWIGSLDPIVSLETNDFNKTAAFFIHQKYEDRKKLLIGNPSEVTNDWLVSCVGEDLFTAMSFIEFASAQEPSKSQLIKLGSAEMSSAPKLDHSQSGISGIDKDEDAEGGDIESIAVIKEKASTISLISDAYSGNTQFVLNILQGYHVEGIETISSFDRKNEDSDADDFSFLDEI